MAPITAPAEVLVADDDPDLRAFLEIVLTGAGYPTGSMATGTELLRCAAARPPRLVVLDVRMPGLSGLDACRALRADPLTACCAVLLISSRTAADDIADGYAAGADDYLTKPFTPRQLVDRVVRLLETARSA
jgi:DNA-binding response OmpR family regulator